MEKQFKDEGREKIRYVVRLFISGDAPNSRIARENLHRLQKRLPRHEFKVEIVDFCLCPEMALEHRVFITPTLQIIEPQPGGVVYGNLSDENMLARVFRRGR